MQHTLATVSGYKYFADMDMMTAYHQVRLASKTSARLSVQTPWGQYQPKLMPDGFGSASAI